MTEPKDFPPYHNAETAKIAEQRAKELEGKEDKPYEYHFNGYTVKEKIPVGAKWPEGILAGIVTVPEGMVAARLPRYYEITADGFSLTLGDKRDAEIYVETHAPYHNLETKPVVAEKAPVVVPVPVKVEEVPK